MSPEDTNEIIKKKSINDEIKGNPWLHILRDGIDNLPTDFVLSFFNNGMKFLVLLIDIKIEKFG